MPLPQQWRMLQIGTVLRRRRETLDPMKEPDREFSFVGLVDIAANGTGVITPKPTRGAEIRSLKTSFHPGDVLYGKLRPYLNKVGVAQAEGICSTDIWAFEPTPAIDSFFAYSVLSTRGFVERTSMLTQGGNLPRINADAFDAIEIPVPPLSEQQRIVAMLQEAESVRRLRAQADQLTNEIIPALFVSMFGEPERNSHHWPLRRLGTLLRGTPQNGLYKPSEAYGEGTPIIRIGDFYDGRFVDAARLQRLRVSDVERANYGVNNGEVLVNRVNSMEHLGKSVLVAGLTEPTVFESNMMRLVPDTAQMFPEYLIEFLQTPAALLRLRRRAKEAVNQASVNQGDLLSLQVPLPPLALQENFRIAWEALRTARSANGEADGKATELFSSLLSHAFSGELTAKWRERHAAPLAREAAERDAALAALGRPVAPRIERPETEAIFDTPTDGLWADLSDEQRALWPFLPYTPFTPKSIESTVRDRLGLDADAIRRHLDVFAARGLLLAVSRAPERGADEALRFAVVYRRPGTVPVRGPAVRVLVAIGDDLVRENTVALLGTALPFVRISSSSDAEATLSMARAERPRIVVVSESLPVRAGEFEPAGVECLQELQVELQKPHLFILTYGIKKESTQMSGVTVIFESTTNWERRLVEGIRAVAEELSPDKGSETRREVELTELSRALQGGVS